MCCFSGTRSVKYVANTRIFGRLGQKGNQVLIYSMDMDARDEVAMVLPVPVKPGSAENAMRFFDFSGYSTVFDDLEAGFPAAAAGYADPFGAAPQSRGAPVLQVQKVGAFEASFVPTIADFSRVDPRFRLADGVWEKLPGYATFGFAVFKFRAGQQKVHPMAFSFPTARAGCVFFPTLHIHDGKIHEKEKFDHALYLQGENLKLSENWEASPGIAVRNVKCGLTHGIVRPEMHVHRRRMFGKHDNADIVLKPLS